jgi:hypothetical protein
MLAQVTATVVAMFRAGNGINSTKTTVRGGGKATDDAKAYSEFQLAKLKGFAVSGTTQGSLPFGSTFVLPRR